MRRAASVALVLTLPAVFAAGCGGSSAAPDPLVRTEDAPVGGDCVNGGTLVLAGPDGDGDGVLADDEVTSRAFVCRDEDGRTADLVEGSVLILSQDDVERLDGVTRVTGNLTIAAAGVGTLRFATLEQVDGTVLAAPEFEEFDRPSALSSLSFPALTSAGSIVISGFTLLGDLSFPALTDIEGSLEIQAFFSSDDDLFADATLSLPLLERAGRISVRGAPRLQNLAFPSLVEVTGGLRFEISSGSFEVSELGTLSLPLLESVGAFSLVGSDLQVLAFPALETVTGDFTLESVERLERLDLDELETMGVLSIINMPALESVSARRLESLPTSCEDDVRNFGRVVVADAAVLDDLDLGALRTARSVELGGLPMLASVDLSALTSVGDECEDSSGGGLSIGGLAALVALDVSDLATASSISLASLPALPTLSLPLLQTVDSLAVQSDTGDNLSTISATSLREAGALVLQVPEVTTLELDALRTANGQIFAPEISECELQMLADQLTSGSLSVSGDGVGCVN